MVSSGHQELVARRRRGLHTAVVDVQEGQQQSLEGDRLFGIAHAGRCIAAGRKQRLAQRHGPIRQRELSAQLCGRHRAAGSVEIQSLTAQKTFEVVRCVTGCDAVCPAPQSALHQTFVDRINRRHLRK